MNDMELKIDCKINNLIKIWINKKIIINKNIYIANKRQRQPPKCKKMY